MRSLDSSWHESPNLLIRGQTNPTLGDLVDPAREIGRSANRLIHSRDPKYLKASRKVRGRSGAEFGEFHRLSLTAGHRIPAL